MDSTRSYYVAALFVFTMILSTLDIYYFNYDFFYKLGIHSSYIEEKLIGLNGTLLFKSPYILRIFIIILVGITIFVSKMKMKITEREQEKKNLIPYSAGACLVYIGLPLMFKIFGYSNASVIIYLIFSALAFFTSIYFIAKIYKLYYADLMQDRFGKEARRFEQCKEKMENENSINIQTEDGWINIVNPFRASMVLGTPGSGKSYAFIIEAIIQLIKKGSSMLLYDYKFPDLSLIAYNAMTRYKENYKVPPKFSIINFDQLTHTNRCNPLQPELMEDPTDAIESAQALMFGLYPKWPQKSGDFFVESAINFVAGCIWALKIIQDGKYCTIPHLIQFTSLEYNKMFAILKQVDDEFINNVMAPFLSAYDQEATDQLEGQLGTVRIAIARLTSPYVYYVMTDDFEKVEKKDILGNPIINPLTQKPEYDYISPSGISVSLQIKDPKNPQIFCLSNNPKKQRVYSPLLSLYNTRLMSLINKKRMNRCGVILDELPTLAFPPSTIDNLIATGRSNKIAVFLGFQDFTQLIRDFGKDIAEAIIGTVGNVFTGQVNYETAKKLSEKFGKIKVKKESISESKDSTSVSINTEMVDLIPQNEISSLSQGTFAGQVADERGQEIEQKVFYSKIIIDHEERKTFEEGEIPPLKVFDEPIDKIVKENFEKIKNDIIELAEAYQSTIETPDEDGEEHQEQIEGNLSYTDTDTEE